MPRRSTLRLTKRLVDGLKVEEKDAIFWDRDLAGFGVRVHATERKLYVVQSRGPPGLKRVTLGPCAGIDIEERRGEETGGGRGHRPHQAGRRFKAVETGTRAHGRRPGGPVSVRRIRSQVQAGNGQDRLRRQVSTRKHIKDYLSPAEAHMREHDILGRAAAGTNHTIIKGGTVTYGPATRRL